ncbi:MAG: NUDIX domain-containing protein [Acidithiobacillus sp.]
MPTTSAAQHRAMEAAAHGNSTLGIPEKVGKEFVAKDSADIESCAGLLLVTQDREFLLLHRTDRDEWEGPGGHVKEGETESAAAIRETFEEVGPIELGEPIIVGATGEYGFRYTTFAQCVPRFTPVLNEEHDEFKWVTAHELPAATHPGTVETITSLTGTDMAIAKAMSIGLLPGPQRYESLWLFDLRVTGTGISFRGSLNEWVYRPPEVYLNQEFLERCNGVPVLFDHSEEVPMTTEEWRNRAIGSLMYAYIPNQDDENHRTTDVWAIARIYDGDAAELMMTTHTSTSPAVQFENPESSRSVIVEDGNRLLIEGNPSYIDHLAVCGVGVWDKGEVPRGIANTTEV